MKKHQFRTLVCTGYQTEARYLSDEQDASTSHNPFIDALPPVMSYEEVISKIRRNPKYRESQRLDEPHLRLQHVQRIANYVEPMPLQIELEQRFSRMIRNGYIARNPVTAEWERFMNSEFDDIDWGGTNDGYVPMIRSTAGGFAMIGTSGMGKSTSVESVLYLYPQVIRHTEYDGEPFIHSQIVWLKLDCPFDGSIKGLCMNFFQAIDAVLGTSYHQKFGSRKTVDELLPNMAKLASEFGVGVLVIDEIQRLNEAKSGGSARMLNFFVQLVNLIGLPVVLVGTFKALPLMRQEFAQARRACNQGDIILTNMEHGAEWDFFINGLWKYQWTDVVSPLTPEISKALYDESQGIMDIAVKLYMNAQWHVIGSGDESITPGLIRQVAKEHLKLVRPMLKALREKDFDKLSQIRDLRPDRDDWNHLLAKSQERVVIEGALNTLRNQQMTADLEGEEPSPLIQIASSLVEFGIQPKIARLSAEQALAQNGHLTDLAMVRREALVLAMQNEQQAEEPQSKQKPAAKKRRVKAAYGTQDLRGIVERGKEAGKSGYESLQEANMIKSATEFLVV